MPAQGGGPCPARPMRVQATETLQKCRGPESRPAGLAQCSKMPVLSFLLRVSVAPLSPSLSLAQGRRASCAPAPPTTPREYQAACL